MLDHHIQRTIVYQLVLAESLRFSELRPDDIENKLFTYHLNKTIQSGIVEKTTTGEYSLTPDGKRLGARVLEDQRQVAFKPHSILFLVIRRKEDGAWLLYRRKVHPLKDKTAFMHASPVSDMSTSAAAQAECQLKTGLSCNFLPLGGGYFRMFQKDQLESFTHFSLLVCNDAKGELTPNHERAGYFWQSEPDFLATDMVPNMSLLVELYRKKRPFFVEETFVID